MRAPSLPLLTILVLAGCGGGSAGPSVPPPPPPAPTPASIGVASGNLQFAPAANPVAQDPAVVVRDAGGQPLAGIPVHFTVTSGGGWVVNDAVLTGSNGVASTSWYLGPAPGTPQALSAGTGSLGTTLTATATPLVPGTTYFGRNGYVEFTAGDGAFILGAPHGGSLTPAEIPDRTTGTTATDTNTDPLARAMADALLVQTGHRPFLVIARLRRTKLDPNREIVEAAAGNPAAIQAWREYHGFIEAARLAAAAANPRAFYLDLHGHGHAIARLEWGYLLAASDLDRSDAALNGGGFATQSSIRSMATLGATSFADLLRGAASLGAGFEIEGYPSVPSPTTPSPGTDPYFNGGYSTERHGSRNGSAISGVQLETYYAGVRDSEASRLAFSAAAARVLVAWLGRVP